MRATTLLVHEKDRRFSWVDVAVAPLQQRDDHRPKVDALLGEAVLIANRVLLVRHLAEDSLLDQQVEAVRQHVACGSGPALEVLEAPSPHERVADDQQRPALPDHLERAGHRADLGIVGSAEHQSENTALSCTMQLFLLGCVASSNGL